MRLARARAPSGAARVGRGRACGRARGLESQNTVHQGPSSKRTEGQAGPADAMFYSVLFLNSDPGPDIPHAAMADARVGRDADGAAARRSRHKSQVTSEDDARGEVAGPGTRLKSPHK